MKEAILKAIKDEHLRLTAENRDVPYIIAASAVDIIKDVQGQANEAVKSAIEFLCKEHNVIL